MNRNQHGIHNGAQSHAVRGAALALAISGKEEASVGSRLLFLASPGEQSPTRAGFSYGLQEVGPESHDAASGTEVPRSADSGCFCSGYLCGNRPSLRRFSSPPHHKEAFQGRPEKGVPQPLAPLSSSLRVCAFVRAYA